MARQRRPGEGRTFSVCHLRAWPGDPGRWGAAPRIGMAGTRPAMTRATIAPSPEPWLPSSVSFA